MSVSLLHRSVNWICTESEARSWAIPPSQIVQAIIRQMFYLIGVNHNAQRHPPGSNLDADQSELQRCLEKAISEHHPTLIAVEESDDTLFNEKTGVVDASIPRNIALQHGIRITFCEPPKDEKDRIGYTCKSDILRDLFTAGMLNDVPSGMHGTAAHAVEIAVMFPKREKCWIERLKDHLHSEVVLVLGEDHIESFGRRLEALGIGSKVICSGIGVSNAQKMEFEAAKRFPIQHAELFRAMIRQIGGG